MPAVPLEIARQGQMRRIPDWSYHNRYLDRQKTTHRGSPSSFPAAFTVKLATGPLTACCQGPSPSGTVWERRKSGGSPPLYGCLSLELWVSTSSGCAHVLAPPLTPLAHFSPTPPSLLAVFA
jgi:hypothetical protein